MKIAVDILPGLGAGVGRWQRETIRALSSQVTRGCVSDICAFSFGKRYGRPPWMPSIASYCSSLLPGRLQTMLTNRFGIPVEFMCRLGHPDVVLGLNLHPLRTSVPVILGVADVSWRTFNGQYRNTFSERQIQSAEEAIRRADHILTLSRCSACDLVRGGVASERITVAHLGVSEEFRSVSDEDVARVRSAYRLPDDFVLYVGGINERKNIATLAMAMGSMFCPPALILIGPVPSEPLSTWGLNWPWIRHLGYVPDQDVPAIMRAATLEVFPSKLEGFGLPLIEAMAVGTPVLASDIPVFREVACDAASFFPPDDPLALSGLIQRAIDSASFRCEYRGRGFARVASLGWDRYNKGLMTAISRAIRR